MRQRPRGAIWTAHLVLVATLVSCGTETPTEPLPPIVQGNTITITASGASPRNIQVALGQRVLFINNDNRSHNMTSDPHPEHTDCPDLNQVGFLTPGQSRETGNLVFAQVCGYHDHDSPQTTSLQGRITVK